jgi:hypothetical protein
MVIAYRFVSMAAFAGERSGFPPWRQKVDYIFLHFIAFF